MANYCEFEIRVLGSKNAGLMVYYSMPCYGYKDIDLQKKEGSMYRTHISGNCKWSVNYGVTDDLDKMDVDSKTEEELEEIGDNYWEYSLRAKSEAFNCEILVHYWSEESGFNQFDHFKNGKVIKQRKIEYDYENETQFDWDKTEFVGHEGEYDENVTGEEDDNRFMSMLLRIGR